MFLSDFNTLASRFGQVLSAEPLGSRPMRGVRDTEHLRTFLEEL